MELLIPYGISNKTNKYIEPDEAERGRDCDCRCPGCDMPLLSRHPKDPKHRKHFAHDSRHADANRKVIEECPFNRWLAVSMMARSLAESFEGKKIHFPKLSHYVGCNNCNLETLVPVTKYSELLVDSAESEYKKFGTVFDLRLVFGVHDVLVWLSYKDRPIPLVRKDQFNELESTGILEIDVNSFEFKAFSKSSEPFAEHVRNFILQEGNRDWVFHPRTKIAIKAFKKNHRCLVRSVALGQETSARIGMGKAVERAIRSIDWQRPPQKKKIEPKNYLCLQCKTEWVQESEGAPECPSGCGLLYARKLD